MCIVRTEQIRISCTSKKDIKTGKTASEVIKLLILLINNRNEADLIILQYYLELIHLKTNTK